MKNTLFHTLLFICSAAFILGCSNPPEASTAAEYQNWEEQVSAVQGEQLTLMMWPGDPLINQYMQDYVQVEVKKRFGIELEIVPGQGNQIVSTLMTELEAGKEESEVDVVWINGETFYQLRQIKALHGPFSKDLPYSKWINWESPFIGTDFQQAVKGYECPWGNVQMTLIYDSARVQTPPMDLAALSAWMEENPGKFTLGNNFTGMTLLKAWLIDFAGGGEALNGPFDEAKYAAASTLLWKYINENKANFWNDGKSFPNDLAEQHRLFANGELAFTLSNNDSEVDNKIAQGLFPASARAYVPNYGSIQNSHYMGITALSSKKAAAEVFINFLISPEAQLKKMDPTIWGDGTVLNIDLLPREWKQQFENIPGRKHAPKRKEIQRKALMEPDPEYMIRLFEDFRAQVIER